MDTLSTILVGILAVIALLLVQVFIIQVGWEMFMTSYFSMAKLDIYQAFGLAILLPSYNYSTNSRKK